MREAWHLVLSAAVDLASPLWVVCGSWPAHPWKGKCYHSIDNASPEKPLIEPFTEKEPRAGTEREVEPSSINYTNFKTNRRYGCSTQHGETSTRKQRTDNERLLTLATRN